MVIVTTPTLTVTPGRRHWHSLENICARPLLLPARRCFTSGHGTAMMETSRTLLVALTHCPFPFSHPGPHPVRGGAEGRWPLQGGRVCVCHFCSSRCCPSPTRLPATVPSSPNRRSRTRWRSNCFCTEGYAT